jgi:hypothetical protein
MKPVESEFVMYDVLYEDGSRTSNRKVPGNEARSLDGDGAVRAYIEAQDEKIAEMSGRRRAPIKSITRSPG